MLGNIGNHKYQAIFKIKARVMFKVTSRDISIK